MLKQRGQKWGINVGKQLIYRYERLETHVTYRMLSIAKPSSRYGPPEALHVISIPPSTKGSLKYPPSSGDLARYILRGPSHTFEFAVLDGNYYAMKALIVSPRRIYGRIAQGFRQGERSVIRWDRGSG